MMQMQNNPLYVTGAANAYASAGETRVAAEVPRQLATIENAVSSLIDRIGSLRTRIHGERQPSPAAPALVPREGYVGRLERIAAALATISEDVDQIEAGV